MTQNDKHWQERSDAWVKAQHAQRIKKEKERQHERPTNRASICSYRDSPYGYRDAEQFCK